jgi:hypothetical protein
LFLSSGDWSSFQAMDDDEVLAVDMREYAVEDDSQETKAAVGASMAPPSIERDAVPIQVPAGACVYQFYSITLIGQQQTSALDLGGRQWTSSHDTPF